MGEGGEGTAGFEGADALRGFHFEVEGEFWGGWLRLRLRLGLGWGWDLPDAGGVIGEEGAGC